MAKYLERCAASRHGTNATAAGRGFGHDSVIGPGWRRAANTAAPQNSAGLRMPAIRCAISTSPASRNPTARFAVGARRIRRRHAYPRRRRPWEPTRYPAPGSVSGCSVSPAGFSGWRRRRRWRRCRWRGGRGCLVLGRSASSFSDRRATQLPARLAAGRRRRVRR